MAGLGSLISGGAGVLGSVAGLFGNNDAEKAQLQALRNAKGDVNAGYSQAQGLEKPIYDTGLGALTGLSTKYGAGGFSNPTSTPFQGKTFDPSQIQNDPEFKALLKTGSDSILGSAEAKGGLFSGNTDRDLQTYGINAAAGQENALRQANLAENQFGAANQQQAYANNANNNATQFNEGANLASNANSGAAALGNLYSQQGSDLGNLDIGQGNARASTILNDTGLIQGGIQGAGNTLGGLSTLDPEILKALLGGLA